MSDQAPEAVEQLPPVHPSVLKAFKDQLFAGLNNSYNALIAGASSMGVNGGFLMKAFSHFDDGMVWLEKAINALEVLPLSPQAAAELKEVEKVVEVADKVVKAVEGVDQASPAA